MTTAEVPDKDGKLVKGIEHSVVDTRYSDWVLSMWLWVVAT